MVRSAALALVLALSATNCGGDGPSLPPLLGATAVSTGLSHTCALMDDATIRCWGDDALGQLGNGETTFSVPVPTAVAGLTGVTSVAAAGWLTCALEGGGAVACWGVNTSCELGNGCAIFGVAGSESDKVSDPNAVAVSALSGPVAALALGAQSDRSGGFACAVLMDGTVECWGPNALGTDPSPTVDVIPPTPVAGLANVTSMAIGGFAACAALADSTVACWGLGALGQPSNASSSSATPLPVSRLSDVVGLAAGEFHMCALLRSRTVACWGDNFAAQLGDGTQTDSATPVMVSGVTGAEAIAASGDRTCALINDGTVACWGGGIAHLTPTAVRGLEGATSISVASQFACAVVANGGIECWGDDSSGQLGDGVIAPASGDPYTAAPVTVVKGP